MFIQCEKLTRLRSFKAYMLQTKWTKKGATRFNSNKHTHMFLLVTQAFYVFIVRMWDFWCAVGVYLKSLNGSPACDCWTQTSWQVMQRDNDCW